MFTKKTTVKDFVLQISNVCFRLNEKSTFAHCYRFSH